MENQEERNNRGKAKETVFLGLSLVPIHRDTQKDMKTDKESVINGHNKKTRKKKARGSEA